MNGYTVDKLEERISYHFRNKELVLQALTHSSFSNEQKQEKTQDYERLEFLGDAVLELVSSEYLFHALKDMQEGELTKRRASMVCEPSLAFCAKDLELGRFMRLGKGEESTGGRTRDSIIADGMEALIGAIYLDSGMEEAKKFIYRFVLNDLEKKQLFYDSKSNLQEVVQGNFKAELSYELAGESGPEHNKSFTVRVKLGGETLGEGTGKTKKAAEQKAAYQALLKLREKGYVFKKH
ncbi:MAG: ribonuclease III [Lachnospiraceae bacterium]|nr:ribonuclease III [Lachnospiraceae bacterium]